MRHGAELSGEVPDSPGRLPKRAHVALMEIGMHGHVTPTLAVARELLARGHRVTYVVPEAFASLVAETGADVVPFRSAWGPADDSLKLLKDFTSIVSYMLDEAENALPQVRQALDEDRPDVILHDLFAYEARVLGHEWGVPAVAFWPFAVDYEGKTNGIAAVYRGLLTDAATSRLRDRFSRWLAENSVEMPLDRFGLRPERGVSSIPRSLQPHADAVDESVFSFVGPCLGDRAELGTWQPPSDERPVLLMSLGSTFTNRPDIYRRCVADFGRSDWHVVLQTGKFVDRGMLGDVPDNVEVHQWLPQVEVLSHATAFITHAGMGGTVEALAHEVPMLALPQGADQFFIADRLVELGVGRRLDNDAVATTGLRGPLEELLALPQLTRRLALLGQEIRACRGAQAAADIVEEALVPTARASRRS
ncbi:macrolide family glycosyltransferase [Streptomyces sulphureus]|uniref:macrolide family glycosyltransferase n=1 Tax=Streptomyces sulphureus TaxID=47758 RepID=UPI0003663236|nr:macrolide family glycosyltransferase [Streptomyces sulphureus]